MPDESTHDLVEQADPYEIVEEIGSQDLVKGQFTSSRARALIIVLGVATVYSEIGYSLVGHVMDVVYGGHRRVHCASVAQLRELWGEQTPPPTLITVDCPDTALSYLLTTSSFPILAFFDDPMTAIIYPAVVERQPLTDAIRFGTRRFSCLMGCAGSPHTQIFDGGSQALTLGGMIDAVFAALGIEAGEAKGLAVQRVALAEGVEASVSIAEIVRRRMNGETLQGAAERFDDAGRALIAWFVAEYGPLLQGQESEAIEWPLALFYVGLKGETGDRDIDLIGGARHIFWGPNLHLPFGGWRAHFQFEVADNVSGNEIEADVCIAATAAQIARRQAKLPPQGYFQFSFDFVNIDPNDALQIRIWLLKGAIEGRFGVRRVSLSPIGRSAGSPAQRVDAP